MTVDVNCICRGNRFKVFLVKEKLLNRFESSAKAEVREQLHFVQKAHDFLTI